MGQTTPRMQHDVLAWHFVEFVKAFDRLVEEHDSRVWRRAGDRTYVTTVHQWCWSALRSLHNLTAELLAHACRTMVGDFKTLSLNPTGRHVVPRARSTVRGAPAVAAPPALAAVAAPSHAPALLGADVVGARAARLGSGSAANSSSGGAANGL